MTRVALVTGAARGLGEGIASRLLDDGWCVVLADASGAHDTAARLDPAQRTATGVDMDVTLEQDCARAVATAVDVFGGLDALVNNAGVGGPSTPVHATDPDDFRRVLDVNLKGTMTVDEIFEEWEIDSKVDSMDLGGALLEIPKLHHKYLTYLSNENRELRKLEATACPDTARFLGTAGQALGAFCKDCAGR